MSTISGELHHNNCMVLSRVGKACNGNIGIANSLDLENSPSQSNAIESPIYVFEESKDLCRFSHTGPSRKTGNICKQDRRVCEQIGDGFVIVRGISIVQKSSESAFGWLKHGSRRLVYRFCIDVPFHETVSNVRWKQRRNNCSTLNGRTHNLFLTHRHKLVIAYKDQCSKHKYPNGNHCVGDRVVCVIFIFHVLRWVCRYGVSAVIEGDG
mmetsp:Transcript_310/g.823  ORF Transcript_310/g.823 Transcript_310/m.823 type:complete len:210 (-) Transcript_310:1465-2094(-)